MADNLLLIILGLPLVGAFLTFFFKSDKESEIKGFTLFISVITFVVSLFLIGLLKGEPIVNEYKWINRDIINSSLLLKVDGISLWLVILSTLIIPLCIVASWNTIKHRVKEFYILLLVMEVGMIGTFMAFDLLFFYIFWEISLIPMYLIIGIWGSENRIYAAVKFFIFTMIGSLFMFLAILYIYIQMGDAASFNLDEIYRFCADQNNLVGKNVNPRTLLFFAFAVSFAIKVPMFPVHTWLPDAHVQAPMAGSVILAGVLLKMGGYGFIRYAIPMFPDVAYEYSLLFVILAIVGIVYGAFMCLAQTDMKKLIAYSSVSHMGFVMLGLFSFVSAGDQEGHLVYQAVQGSIYQMLNHGVSTGALFFLVGFLYDRRHTKEIAKYGGIAKSMPIYSAIFMIILLSSIGLPGTNGFIGEFLILLGSFKANSMYAIFAATGVVLGAAYMLILFQKVFYGPIVFKENKTVQDLNAREIFVFIPLIILVFLMGFFSPWFMDKIDLSLGSLPNIAGFIN